MNVEESPGSPQDKAAITGNQIHSGRKSESISETIGEQNLLVQRVVQFSDIACGTAEVVIEHEGQKYRLRATRNGRLLLNK